MSFIPNRRLLRRTSRLWGVQTSYLDQQGQVHEAPTASLLLVLEGLSKTKITSDQNLEALCVLRHQTFEAQGLEPVHVKWVGEPAHIRLILNADEKNAALSIQIEGEDGFRFQATWTPAPLERRPKWTLPADLPAGYHTLKIKTPTRELSSLLVCAPAQITAPADLNRSWGVFAPLYAVRSESDWGLGSYRDLQTLSDMIRPEGGKWISSLPLLAGNFDTVDCDPSPYSALTRLFWNELYLDVEALVNASGSRAATELLKSETTLKEIRRLRESDYVDYHAAYELKRKILAVLAQEFFAAQKNLAAPYQEFLKLFPDLDAYVQFRSADPAQQNFHRFVQFQTHQTLTALKTASLYMDYPVGVNESGFDFHQYREIFFSGVEVGAPPEPVFQLGQGWGFPSYHPDRLRESRYAYVRRTLENHFRYSRILRLDHVMGLHRVFVIPSGKKPKDGVYLRYKPQEFFALACLEASRVGADLIGENLGTVPAAVDEILEKRNFKTMTVGQFLFEEPPPKLRTLFPEKTLACLNTHDMPLFAAFLTGEDLDQVTQLGILNPAYTEPFKKARLAAKENWKKMLGTQSDADLFPEVLKNMAESRARYVILNPEDAWNETRPQNIPGTYREVPNWRRKFVIPLEKWSQNDGVKNAFSLLAKSRP
jgi:4-alpha-glucanotransferase